MSDGVGVSNFWCWVQICRKPKFPTRGGGGGGCPNFWRQVQICLKTKFPMSSEVGGGEVMSQLSMQSPNCVKPKFPMSPGGGQRWCPNPWCCVQNCLKPKFSMSAEMGEMASQLWSWIQTAWNPNSLCRRGGGGGGGEGSLTVCDIWWEYGVN